MKMFDISAATQSYFDVRSAAVRLGVAEITVRRMVSMRQIEHLRVGSGAGRVLFTQAHLDAYLQRRTVPVAQAA
jgi:excisionase family DNA binding protein